MSTSSSRSTYLKYEVYPPNPHYIPNAESIDTLDSRTFKPSGYIHSPLRPSCTRVLSLGQRYVLRAGPENPVTPAV